ncbi:MAG: hypothetical protein EOM55_02245 [Clostridia bacterium]|nr:hypothetical protein [Clostridia bacterium]
MNENIATVVEKVLASEVANLGFELYEVDYSKKQNGMNLTLFITKQDGEVDIEDCVQVHHMADKLLEELNPTKDEPYILNVSSLGLDKLLKSDKDFERAFGKKVEVTLFRPVLDTKSLSGILMKFDSEKIVLSNVEEDRKSRKKKIENIQEISVEILRDNLASCKLYVEI